MSIMSSSGVMDIVTADDQTYDQKALALAQYAENSIEPIKVSDRCKYYFKCGALCDMNEGKAPYRPRYLLVDFDKFVEQGSKFLRLAPPSDIDELINNLEILYTKIPSVTGRPVFVGQLDKIFNPFIGELTDEEAMKKISCFLTFIDRTIANGYCHANLGPEETRAGRLILKAEQKLQNTTPNFTLKYDPDITPDDFASLAISTSLACANPAFANDRIHRKTYRGEYGICSCFNILPIGGGGYCLSRIVLPYLASRATSIKQFMNELLPEAVGCLLEYMNARVSFIVEQSHFFDSSFLVKEGLVNKDRFVGMFGVAGLCDCVNHLFEITDGPNYRYGKDAPADDLADSIMICIADMVAKAPAVYSPLTGNRFLLHAQAGLAPQKGVTPGVRIIVGDEPKVLFDHIRHSARFHRFFPTGVSDIFPVESTAKRNLDAILDVMKGAFRIGDKYMSFYTADGDFVRITGYLVKKSEMEAYKSGKPVLHDTAHGADLNYENNNLADRLVRF